jgi:hypothetical protein
MRDLSGRTQEWAGMQSAVSTILRKERGETTFYERMARRSDRRHFTYHMIRKRGDGKDFLKKH